MVIAGYNDNKIAEAGRGLVAVPSAAVTQMLTPLKKLIQNMRSAGWLFQLIPPLLFMAKLRWMNFFSQIRRIYMNDTLADSQKVFNKQIAFNVIPQIGDFIGEETQCEWAMNAETKKFWAVA